MLLDIRQLMCCPFRRGIKYNKAIGAIIGGREAPPTKFIIKFELKILYKSIVLVVVFTYIQK